MSDPDLQRLRDKLYSKLATAKHLESFEARTGRIDVSTGDLLADPRAYDANGTLLPNRIWVRIYPTQQNPVGRGQVVCWNTSPRVNDLIPDAAVVVGYNKHGQLKIIDADDEALNLWAGAAAPAVFGGPNVPGELNTDPVPLANVTALKPYRGAAGELRALPGWLPNGEYWDDSTALNLLDHNTATSGKTSYVVAGIDLVSSAWTADASTDQSLLSLWPGNAADVETVLQAAAFATVFPIAAVPMAESATDFDNADIIDLRTWGAPNEGIAVTLSTNNISNPPTQEELVTAYGDPWDLGRRFIGLLDDNGLGTKPYAILSDGQQFVGLPLTVFRSELATDALVRQGNVITAGAHEETTAGELCVIYEDDPQLLTGAARVYKGWWRVGWSPGYIVYGESYDGVTWVRHPDVLVADAFSPHVVHDGATYYLYVASGLYAQIDVYTSTDGIAFTLDTAAIISPATGWEDLNVANPDVWVEGGTWYMLYDGYSGTKWSIGLATASDHNGPWTKSGSNPVVTDTGTRGSAHVQKIGSTYWMICLGSASGTLPTDLYRYHATSLTSWTSDGLYVARTSADEGPSPSVVGQVADPFFLIVNGVLKVWYAASTDGTASSGNYHIKLITGKSGLLTA